MANSGFRRARDLLTQMVMKAMVMVVVVGFPSCAGWSMLEVGLKNGPRYRPRLNETKHMNEFLGRPRI
jgi:hypothetical protein